MPRIETKFLMLGLERNMLKILIADDSQFMRKKLRDILDKEGYKDILEAEDGVEALRIWESKKRPDLVLLDIIMPNVDGRGVLKKMNKSDVAKRLIIVTAVGQEKMKQETKKLGVKHYIIKPFQEKEVIEMIKKVSGALKRK